MVGDVWLTRSHGGLGFRGWLQKQLADMITLVKPGRNLPWNHAMIEIEGGLLLDAGKRVQLTDGRLVLADTRRSVLVVRGDFDGLALDAIHEAGMQMVGLRYSHWTALGHVFGRKVAAFIAKLDGEPVICSELVAQVLAKATGFRFTQRHTGDQLEPGAVRPRDIAWTVSTAMGTPRFPWRLVMKTSHGKVVAHAGIA